MSRKWHFLTSALLFLFAARLPAQQLPNLTDPSPATRFTVTDKDWPASAGGASICLWEDDKLAAFSFGVDDNAPSNVSWWLDQADSNDFQMTWFVITDNLSDSHDYTGTWPQYTEALARGHDVQSHTCTHENTDAEYHDSQIAIETNLPGHQCEFLAYPGGTTYPLDPTAAAQYYAGARGTGGSINQANKIAYMNTCAMSSYNISTPAYSWSYLPNLFDSSSPYYRGWTVNFFHYINPTNYAYAQALIDFYVAHHDDLWGGLYGEVSKYGQERDTATLTVIANTSSLIQMTLTDQMLDSRFNYPLTIKVRLPSAWTGVQATQNGTPVESTVVQNAGANYALVKAVPDQGVIELTDEVALQMTNTLTQFGITWTFDDDYPVGQYANGDWWVLGPVNIIDVSNNYHTNGIYPAYGEDGCMINPGTNDKQGYDIRLLNYQAALNKSYPNGASISSTNALVLDVDSSLVSSVSWLVGEPGCPTVNTPPGGPRPSVRTMAILTCVSNAPSGGAFRPPYCGTDKTSYFNLSQLDYSRLGNLPPVASTPALASVEEHFDGPWVDHVYTWIGGYTHPWEHMPNYGRDMSVQISEAALMLQLDFSQLPGSPSKETLLMRIAQLGIDFTGIADNGGGWQSDGGHHMGRKFPILLAGRVLHDAHMENVGQWTTEFQEDLDTFYVSQAEVDMTHSAAWDPDTRAGVAAYETNNIGLPEWGIRHVAVPESDNLHWNCTYRSLNNLSYPGWVLATLIMGQRTAWNHEVLFDYIDRAVAVGPYEYLNDYYQYGGTFMGNMWRAYRANYPPQWVPYDDTDFYSLGTQVWSGSVTAAFSAAPSSGEAPLAVTFTDTSIGLVTNRIWDFGDGSTSNTSAATVLHTYIAAGTYTVELVVSGPAGVDTNAQIAAVAVTAAAFGSSTTNIVANEADASVYSTSGTVEWYGSASSRIGNNAIGTLGTHVMPFLLPDLQGNVVTAASLSAFCNGANANVHDTPDVYIDLIGVRVSSSSTVLATDYTGMVLVDGAYKLDTSLTAGTLTFTSASLAAYIQSIYDNDANAAGKYVFLTVAPDASSTYGYAYTDLSAADNSTVANRPVLTLEIGSPSSANPVTVASVASDRSIGLNSSGIPVAGYDGESSLSAGDDNYTYNNGDRCGVAVFSLPDSGGSAVSSANLSAWISCAYPGGSDSFPKGLDIYAVRSSASSTVLTNDYGFKGNGSGTLIQQNFFLMANNNPTFLWAEYETDSSADTALANWLAAQYAAGAQPGDYAFFRFELNGNTANAIQIASADNTDTNLAPPQLTVGFGTADADSIAMAANGVNTWLEAYIAGLDPADPASRFTVSNDRNALCWNAVSGRVYSVWWSTNLLEGFQPLETNIVWPQNCWTNPANVDGAFYRLKVELE